MKKITAFLMMLAVAGGYAAPIVTGTAVSEDEFGRLNIEYTLEGESAAITIELQMKVEGEWIPLPMEDQSEIFGAANMVIRALGEKQKAWWIIPEKYSMRQIRADVTAWPFNAPPPYMVVDLHSPSNVSYYATAEGIPGGITNDIYKTTKIVMRRIPARGVVWTMGAEPTAPNRPGDDVNGKRSTPFNVVLSEDYYIAIYEMTQKQMITACTVGGELKIKNVTPFKGDKLPIMMTSMYGGPNNTIISVRGDCNSYVWPTNGHNADPNSLVGLLRKRTGIQFDAPTSAQWEFAAKGTCMNEFGEYNRRYNASRFAEENGDLGWYNGNWSADSNVTSNQIHEVGLLKPNCWGLYDMLGNVSEPVLEGGLWGSNNRYSDIVDKIKPTVDPTCPETYAYKANIGGRYWMSRGGHYDTGANNIKVNSCIGNNNPYTGQTSAKYNYYPYHCGLRLCAPASIE